MLDSPGINLLVFLSHKTKVLHFVFIEGKIAFFVVPTPYFVAGAIIK